MNSISNRSLGVSVTSGVICALGIIFIGTSALFLLETEVDLEGSGTSSRELPNSFVETLRGSARGRSRGGEISLFVVISTLEGGLVSLSDRACFFLKSGWSVLKDRISWGRVVCCLAQVLNASRSSKRSRFGRVMIAAWGLCTQWNKRC